MVAKTINKKIDHDYTPPWPCFAKAFSYALHGYEEQDEGQAGRAHENN